MSKAHTDNDESGKVESNSGTSTSCGTSDESDDDLDEPGLDYTNENGSQATSTTNNGSQNIKTDTTSPTKDTTTADKNEDDDNDPISTTTTKTPKAAASTATSNDTSEVVLKDVTVKIESNGDSSPLKATSAETMSDSVVVPKVVVPSPLTYVTKVEPNDVLLGRGAPIINNEGNVRFRKVVAERKALYTASCRHKLKNEIAFDVIHEIIHKRKGRFLRRVDDSEYVSSKEYLNGEIPSDVQAVWVIADDMVTLQKVKQALREHDERTSNAKQTEGGKENADDDLIDERSSGGGGGKGSKRKSGKQSTGKRSNRMKSESVNKKDSSSDEKGGKNTGIESMEGGTASTAAATLFGNLQSPANVSTNGTGMTTGDKQQLPEDQLQLEQLLYQSMLQEQLQQQQHQQQQILLQQQQLQLQSNQNNGFSLNNSTYNKMQRNSLSLLNPFASSNSALQLQGTNDISSLQQLQQHQLQQQQYQLMAQGLMPLSQQQQLQNFSNQYPSPSATSAKQEDAHETFEQQQNKEQLLQQLMLEEQHLKEQLQLQQLGSSFMNPPAAEDLIALLSSSNEPRSSLAGSNSIGKGSQRQRQLNSDSLVSPPLDGKQQQQLDALSLQQLPQYNQMQMLSGNNFGSHQTLQQQQQQQQQQLNNVPAALLQSEQFNGGSFGSDEQKNQQLASLLQLVQQQQQSQLLSNNHFQKISSLQNQLSQGRNQMLLSSLNNVDSSALSALEQQQQQQLRRASLLSETAAAQQNSFALSQQQQQQQQQLQQQLQQQQQQQQQQRNIGSRNVDAFNNLYNPLSANRDRNSVGNANLMNSNLSQGFPSNMASMGSSNSTGNNSNNNRFPMSQLSNDISSLGRNNVTGGNSFMNNAASDWNGVVHPGMLHGSNFSGTLGGNNSMMATNGTDSGTNFMMKGGGSGNGGISSLLSSTVGGGGNGGSGRLQQQQQSGDDDSAIANRNSRV